MACYAQATLCQHIEWKIKRLRPRLMRYIWDLLPHARTFAKNGDPIPPCPICSCDLDDIHHVLVECQHSDIKSLRTTTIRKALRAIQDIPYISSTAVAYAKTLARLLQIPDPSRLSHAIWFGRPFRSTLMAADELMPRPLYPGAILSPLAHHLPVFLLPLLEGAIRLWKLRCKLIHPPEQIPLVRLSAQALRRLHTRQRKRTARTSSTQSQRSTAPSSLPTIGTSQSGLSSSQETPHPPRVATLPSPTEELQPPTIRTYVKSVIPCSMSPHTPIRLTSLEAVAAQPLPEADNSPHSSIK